MAINAVMDGTSYSDVSSISIEGRSSTKTIQLSETGVIPTPTATKNITTNGTHDVTNYKNAQVNVPQGITPSGTKSISANGTYDVTDFASAEVNVPSSGITPSGSIEITANGTYDVTSLASAVVNVVSGGGNVASGEFEVSAETKTGSINIGLSELNIFVLILEGIVDTSTSGWKSVGILREFNESFTMVILKNGTSYNRNNTGTFTYSNGVLSFSGLTYNLEIGTYKWYAC